MVEISTTFVNGAACKIAVHSVEPDSGKACKGTLVMLHGMRDSGPSMLMLSRFLPGYRLIAPDLRGHGGSEKPGNYSLLAFVADLHAVIETMTSEPPILVGHSLGGHIVQRYASLYSSELKKLVLLDGMGPPPYDGAVTDEGVQEDFQEWRDAVSGQLLSEHRPRPLSSFEDAIARLRRNNARLTEEHARVVAESSCEKRGEEWCWNWDPRVESIWTTFSHLENQSALKYVECPVLILTGDEGLDYWSARWPEFKGREVQYQQDLDDKVNLFRFAHRETIAGAGHMLHYDQPDKLARHMDEFISGQ